MLDLNRYLRHPPRGLVLDDAEPYRASCAPGGRFFEAWMLAAERDGRGPQVVLRSRVHDGGLLADRGIGRLEEPAALVAGADHVSGAGKDHTSVAGTTPLSGGAAATVVT